MKKLIPVILILAILGVGAYFFLTQKNGTVPQTGQIQNKLNQSAGDVITSIKDAVLKSTPLKCEYPDAEGNTVTTYIKGENIRVMGYVSPDTKTQGNMLMKGDKLYIWDDQTKKGTVMTLQKETVTQTTTISPSVDRKTETVQNLEKYKNYCKVDVTADSTFNVPTDVQFTDFDLQMKNSGVDIQKLMEQYQTSPPPNGE